MANLNGRNPSSNIKAITTEDNTMFLLSNRVASLNFDGLIPRDNSLVYASDLTVGQTIFSTDPTARDNSFFITRIDTAVVTVEGVDETSYSLFYLGQNDLEEQYTYGAENIDGSFSQNHLFNVYKDDVSDISLGNNGWMLTNEGNAVFSNVFVRGTVEATSGKIDGILKIGESKEGLPLVTIGKNIFNSSSFEGSLSEHNGIFLDRNNYLMAYEVPTLIPVTSMIATNTTRSDALRKATFTLNGHTLAVNDLVSISGFAEDKFMELDNVFPVKEITTNTFTVYYKNAISGTTNPITVDLKVESFALNNIYQVTQLSLTEDTLTENLSEVKVYFSNNYTPIFTQNQSITLSSVTNPNLNINGSYSILSVTEVVGQSYDYFTITTPRVTAGTYTTDLGQINLYDSNYKFKVGDENNSMSYNSYTGALTVTGTINANAGNFTNAVTVGKASRSYTISNKQLTNNVAIITTGSVHSFVVGDSVTITGVDSTFNGTYTVTSVPTGESFTYAKTATNVSSTVVSPVGLVTNGDPSNGSILIGYGTNQISINGTGTDTTSAIFAGAGNYGNADTGFFMDASGRFSLKDKLTFTSTGDLTVSGTINANAGNFTNTVTIGQSSTQGKLQVGTGSSFFEIIGTNNILTTAIKTNNSTGYNTSGVWIGADGKFSLGNNQLYFDGANLFAPAITTTSLTVGTSPNQMIMSPTAIPGGSGSPGLYMTKTGDFINATTGGFRLGSSTGISYSGTGIVTIGTGVDINGNISGASGTFTGSLSGSTITGGTIRTSANTGNGSTAGVIIDSTSARFFNSLSATPVTTISTATGALTATSANITGTINAQAGIFSGNIQTTGKIYSGSLDPGGLLTSGIEVASTGIKGIINGITAFNLPADGVTKPTITNFDVLNAKITGSGANAYLIAGTISDNITVRGDKTGVDATGAIFNTVSNTPTTFASGTGFYLNESGFFKIGSITSHAKFDPTANGGSGIFSVTGTINATSGSFTNTINVGGATAGTLQVGSGSNKIKIVGTGLDSTTYINTGSTTATTGDGFYFGADGKIRIASSTNSLTFDGTNLNIVGGGTFSGSLSAATGTFSGALSGGTISIGSGNSIFKADTNGIYLGNAVFASAPFRVTPAGALTATNANITGTITATSGSFTGTVNAASGSFSGYMTTASGARFGTNVSSTNDGLYLNANNYFMTNGTATLFRAGTSTNFLQMNSTDTSTRLQIDTTNSTYAVEVGGSVRVNGTLAYFYGDLIGTASNATNAGALDSLDSSAFLRSNASDSWAAATLTFTPTGAGAGLVFDAGFTDTSNDPVLVSNGTAHTFGRIGRPGNRFYAGYFSLLYAGTSQITSDIREKKDIENSDLGLDFINMLRPVKYKMINGIKKQFDSEGNQLENTPGTRWHYGLIAQELKQTLDTYGLDSAMWSIEDFETNPDGKQAISYNQVVSPLIKAVQELSETIQILENRLAALES